MDGWEEFQVGDAYDCAGNVDGAVELVHPHPDAATRHTKANGIARRSAAEIERELILLAYPALASSETEEERLERRAATEASLNSLKSRADVS